MKAKLHFVLSTTMILFTFSVFGQKSNWKQIEKIENRDKLEDLNLNSEKSFFFELNNLEFNQTLSKFKTSKGDTTIKLPGLNGKLHSFKISERSNFAPSLAAKYPNIKSFVGISTDGLGTKLRMSTSPNGIQTMISYTDETQVFMHPTAKGSNQYIVYNKDSKNHHSKPFNCKTIEDLSATLNKNSQSKINEGGANDQTLQKFRIAISVTGEYTAYHGGTVSDALAAINATLSRVNEIFETDMAVTFELIDATQLIYTNAATDPYSNSSVGADDSNFNNTNGWSLQLQNTLSTELGANLSLANAAYDIGHLFGDSGGGGNAGCIGCVCRDDSASFTDHNKGSGFTSPGDDIPEGDSFDLNYVIHEIGHQMGANHTWSFSSEGTNVQVEPGSGSTIMAYAGITDEDDIQLNSDPYFHYQSIKQILDNLTSKTCQTTSSIINSPPIANAGNDYIIPIGTPYVLKGSVTDANSEDTHSFCWEQIDNGIINSANYGATRTSGSLNRSLPPSSSPDRYIPNIQNVIHGQLTESNPGVGSSWESVSNINRTLNWAITVRDRNPSNASGNAQSSYDTMKIDTDATSGPFLVSSQNSNNINWTPGNIETIVWDVANTNSTPINTSHVNILLSTDRGLTFPTVLVENTPNDGSQNINVPFISAPFCRVKVEAVDNIYYAINNTDFAINYTINTTCNQTYNSSNNLNIGVSDTTTGSHTINVPESGIISSLKVSIDVSHSYIDDLVIEITHPNGTSASKIWNRNCFNESNIQLTFEDWADNINCSSTASSGVHAPSESLAIFNGLNMTGNWQISLTDFAPGDNGTLNSWSLDFCTQTTELTNLGIEEPEDTLLPILFPNPNTGTFEIAFKPESNLPISIIVSDSRGRIILNKTYPTITNFRQEVQLINVFSGMYILTITDGVFYTKKKVIIK